MNNSSQIKGYEGRYTIFTNGIIISSWRNNELTPCLDNDGYLIVTLYNGKKGLTQKLHRLLAQAFIPNPLNKKTVNHKDGNKLNNELSNLEWNTQGENNVHAFKNGIKIAPGKDHMDRIREGALKKVRQPIGAYDFKTNKKLWECDGITNAAKKYNLTKNCITRVLAGTQIKHRGLYFIRLAKIYP